MKTFKFKSLQEELYKCMKIINHKTLRKNEQGFTLSEAVIGSLIVFSALAGTVPLMIGYQLKTIESEIKSGAIAAASQIMDQLRQCEVSTLPSSGTTTIPASNTATTSPCGTTIPPLQYMGDKSYSAQISYCQNSSNCDTNTRQIQVQIFYGNKTQFQAETVYTSLQ